MEAIRVLLEHDPPIDHDLKDVLGETALQKVEGYPSRVAVEIAALISGESGRRTPPHLKPRQGPVWPAMVGQKYA